MKKDRTSRPPRRGPRTRSWTAWAAAAGLLPLMALSGCRESAAPRVDRDLTAAGAVFRPAIEASLLLISLDTTRADHLGCYGYARGTSPAIDRLAAEGHRFDGAYTVMPTTLPSHAAMFTSLYPTQLGVLGNGFVLPEEANTLAERLAARGFATGAFISAAVMHAKLGLKQGFETYAHPPRSEWRAERTCGYAIEWLRQHGKRRFFCFVHLFDPHTWYDAPPDFRRRFDAPDGPQPAGQDREFLRDPAAYDAGARQRIINAYDAEIAYADQQIGRLLEALRAAGAEERTVVVFLSDHGETLDELIDRHGYGFDHGEFLYRRELRVPLILRLPKGLGLPAQGVHVEPVSTLDLMPTLLELLGVPCEGRAEGRSLVRMLAGQALERRRIVSRRHAVARGERTPAALDSDEYSVIEGRWHWITCASRATELFDVQADPAETRDLIAAHDEFVEGLRRHLRRWQDDFGAPLWGPPRLTDDPRLLGGIQALGYVTGDGGHAATRPASSPAAP